MQNIKSYNHSYILCKKIQLSENSTNNGHIYCKNIQWPFLCNILNKHAYERDYILKTIENIENTENVHFLDYNISEIWYNMGGFK